MEERFLLWRLPVSVTCLRGKRDRWEKRWRKSERKSRYASIWNFWLDRTPESRKKKKTGREKAFSRTLLLVADVWTGSVQYDETRQHGAGQFRLTSYGRCSTLLVYSMSTLYIHPHTEHPDYRPILYSSSYAHPLSPASHRGVYLFVKLRANFHPTFRNRIHATFSSERYIVCRKNR